MRRTVHTATYIALTAACMLGSISNASGGACSARYFAKARAVASDFIPLINRLAATGDCSDVPRIMASEAEFNALNIEAYHTCPDVKLVPPRLGGGLAANRADLLKICKSHSPKIPPLQTAKVAPETPQKSETPRRQSPAVSRDDSALNQQANAAPKAPSAPPWHPVPQSPPGSLPNKSNQGGDCGHNPAAPWGTCSGSSNTTSANVGVGTTAPNRPSPVQNSTPSYADLLASTTGQWFSAFAPSDDWLEDLTTQQTMPASAPASLQAPENPLSWDDAQTPSSSSPVDLLAPGPGQYFLEDVLTDDQRRKLDGWMAEQAFGIARDKPFDKLVEPMKKEVQAVCGDVGAAIATACVGPEAALPGYMAGSAAGGVVFDAVTGKIIDAATGLRQAHPTTGPARQ